MAYVWRMCVACDVVCMCGTCVQRMHVCVAYVRHMCVQHVCVRRVCMMCVMCGLYVWHVCVGA